MSSAEHYDEGASLYRPRASKPLPPLAERKLMLRPWHSRKYAPFSREWFVVCDEAFTEAMIANPTERP